MWLMQTFSEWLVSALQERDMTPADLARSASISNGSLSDLMSGRRKAGSEIATAIAKALRIPPIQVFQAAGLLPPDKVKHDHETEQVVEELSDLTTEEKKEVLSYIRWRRNNRKK